MKARAIAIDVTRHYRGLPLEVASIRDCYAYDPESATYLCELTPSHYLIYLYTALDCREGTDPERCDELDSQYCHEGGDDIYMHVSDVRKMTSVDAGEFDDMESAWEHLCGNWVVP